LIAGSSRSADRRHAHAIRSRIGDAPAPRGRPASADLFGQGDDDARGAAEITEPVEKPADAISVNPWRSRLEVTALGDAVNECARIQESARHGQALASKALIENLTTDDAAALGLHGDSLVYRTIADKRSAVKSAVRR